MIHIYLFPFITPILMKIKY